ncbi:hypothetical protein N9L01_00385 [bacterium]|nr:hypothetical protein [bacterium]
MSGYNITCDPGDLYSRKCYVNTASGKQEIIGYDSAGNPVSKAPTTAAGTAWQPNITVLNQDGNAYQPYGAAGLPFTMAGGISGVGAIMPSSGSDPQDWKYLQTMPGANARKTYQERVCNPLWPTLGCRQGSIDIGTDNGATMPESKGFFSKIKSIFASEEPKTPPGQPVDNDSNTVAGEDPAVQDTSPQPQEPAVSSEKQTGLTPAGKIILPALAVGIVGVVAVGAYLNYKMFTYDPGLYVAGKSVGALGMLARDTEE